SQAVARRLDNNPQQLARSLRQIGLGSQPNLFPLLSQIKLPSLLIVGDLDQKFVAIAQKIARSIPQANLKTVKDAGHNVHFEHPQDFIQLLQHFLLKTAVETNEDFA
ncbi:MAG: 2-succinyl-6-hydroxy-2,4-cyclohexadiene-1-carboxylate synthase, partial [Cyanobacteria bacterium J06623_7]